MYLYFGVVIATILYWVIVGHGHTWVFVALAIGAALNEYRNFMSQEIRYV